jgi:hypothetical protein
LYIASRSRFTRENEDGDDQRHHQAVTRVRDHHAHEVDEKGHHDHGRVKGAGFGQREARHDGLKRRGRFGIVQEYRRLLALQRIGKRQRDGRRYFFQRFLRFLRHRRGNPALQEEGFFRFGQLFGRMQAVAFGGQNIVQLAQRIHVLRQRFDLLIGLQALVFNFRLLFVKRPDALRSRDVYVPQNYLYKADFLELPQRFILAGAVQDQVHTGLVALPGYFPQAAKPVQVFFAEPCVQRFLGHGAQHLHGGFRIVHFVQRHVQALPGSKLLPRRVDAR